jgi:hypothetical protein
MDQSREAHPLGLAAPLPLRGAMGATVARAGRYAR